MSRTVHHTDQSVAFRSGVFHLSAASVLFFLKAKFRSIDVGGLYEYLAKELVSSSKFLSITQKFTLVNVYSSASGFSRGISLPPEPRYCPHNDHLIFTFAYDNYDRPSDLELTVRSNRSNSVVQYGDRHSATAFTSIGLSSFVCAKFGLSALYGEHLGYLYNILGVMTKSLARNLEHYRSATSYTDLYSTDFKSLHDKYGRRSLYKTLTKTPYAYWVYCPVIWRYAPNLLSPKVLTSDTSLYYFMYVHGSLGRLALKDRLIDLLGLSDPAEGTVIGYLADSLLAFTQGINTPGRNATSSADVMAPAVIYSLLSSGKSRIDAVGTTDSQVWDDLAGTTHSLTEAFSGLNTDVGNLFLPPESTALKLFRSDRSYVSRLAADLDFSQMSLL